MVSGRVDYEQRWRGEWRELQRLGPLTRSLHRLIGKVLEPYLVPGARVLDVGCGNGRLLALFGRRVSGLVLAGIEGSQAAVAQAPAAIRDRIFRRDLDNGFSLDPPLFDIVVCSEVLEHLKEYRPALASIVAHTRPGGHILIAVPHSRRYWSQSDEFAGHYRRFEYYELADELRRAGLHPVRYFTWGFPVAFLYNKLVTRVDPSTLMRPRGPLGAARTLASEVLYHAMKLDDLFRGRGWHQLIALAQRNEGDLRGK